MILCYRSVITVHLTVPDLYTTIGTYVQEENGGSVLPRIPGIHWGSSNVSPAGRRCLVHLIKVWAEATAHDPDSDQL